jgi:MYXO-CTERM domain-containing protein
MKTLAFVLLLASAVPVYATAPNNTTVERRQTTTVDHDDDDRGLWGLLGLLGLGGLAGLTRKDRVRNPDGTFSRKD